MNMENTDNIMPFTRKREYAFSGFFLFVFLRFHFLCPCDPDHGRHIRFCLLYIIFPAILCFFFTLVIACLRMKASPSKDGCSCSKCCAVFLRALSMGLFWAIIVFFDGDWWVCLMTHSDSEAEEQVACKQETNLTKMEKVKIRYQTNVSRVSITIHFIFSSRYYMWIVKWAENNIVCLVFQVIALVFTSVMVPIWLCATHRTKSSKQRHSEGQHEEEEDLL